MSTILESEIPKYFGDTSTAAGYVLFYQAVDLDPEVIGLSPKPAPAFANGCANTSRSPLLFPEDSKALSSTQAHSMSTSGTPPNSLESATAVHVSSEIEAPLPSPHKLNKSASGIIKPSELSVASSNPSTSSQTVSTSFFRKKDGLSSEGGELSPARRPLHKEPSSLFSPLPHIGEKDKEKEHHRSSWFRTRRKDSLPPSSSISSLLQSATPNLDSVAVSASSLPSYADRLHVVQRRQSYANLLPIATSVRSAPDSPQLSPRSKRTSTTNPEVPPVPPLPMGVEPSPITSTHHLVVPPTPHHVMPVTSQDPPGHRRRPSLSKSPIPTFMRSRTSPGTVPLDTPTPHRVTLISPTPTNHHNPPQQASSAMITSRSRPLSAGDPDSSQSDSAPIANSAIVDGERLHSSTSTSRTSTIDPLPHDSETEGALADLLNRSLMPPHAIANEPQPASPLVEKEKEREMDKVKTGGSTKRASKKMNLSGGLSIFGGWVSSSKDKDKDKKVHGTDGPHQLQLHDHRNDVHHHREPPLIKESETFERTSGESERRERQRPGNFPSDVSPHFVNGLTEFSYGY